MAARERLLLKRAPSIFWPDLLLLTIGGSAFLYAARPFRQERACSQATTEASIGTRTSG